MISFLSGRNVVYMGLVMSPAEHGRIRTGLLKGLYLFTVIVAGLFGLVMLAVPDTTEALFAIPMDNPMIYGIAASVFLAFAIASILGFRAPLKFVPVLLMQLTYKSIWVIFVALPALLNNTFPSWAYLTLVTFLAFIVWDLIAIPFWTLFEKETPTVSASVAHSKT